MCYNNKLTGFLLLLGTAVFSHEYTKYFGYNWVPTSRAELVCDTIALCMTVVSIRLFFRKN